MKLKIFAFSLFVAVLAQSAPVSAEDIDLFVGRSTDTTEAPNVLLVLDNTGNWGPVSKFDAQRAALVKVLKSVDADNLAVNVGLMMYTETSSDDTGPDGGYVRAAIRPLGSTLDELIQLIGDPNNPDPTLRNGLDVTVDRSNSGKSGKTMAEAYLYFSGGQPYSGNKKAKTDFEHNAYVNSNSTCCSDSYPIWDLPDNALLGADAVAAKMSNVYNGPYDPNTCAENFIIFIGNGPAQDSSADNTEARNLLLAQPNVGSYASSGGPTFELNPSGSEDNLADEWAYYMNKDAPVKVSTYAIDVNIVNNASQCGNNANGGWSELMKSMSATHGGGNYYNLCSTAFDPNSFALSLEDAFRGILSRNSVFASVALPAAANQQSTFLNQVFVGMFRPDAKGLPRWAGNLKQYKIGLLGGSDLQTVDADGVPLIDTTNTENGGFVQGCARSFWTPTVADTYWSYLLSDGDADNDPVQNCVSAAAVSNTPDGNIVEKGAQAYVLRSTGPGSRNVLTCDKDLATCNSTGAGTGLIDFATTNTDIDMATLDANDATDRDEMISWAIGYDVDDEDADGTTNEMRPSVHADVVHSQPVAMDYAGDPNNPQVVVFYGANDGMLRAINGNQSGTQGSTIAGNEFWAFMPPEFFSKIRRQRVNTEYIKFPASGPTEGMGSPGTEKDYGMDGPLSAYELDTNGDAVVDKRLLFAGMRRGGRMLYSFDITTKDAPALNWKIGCPNATGGTGCTFDDSDTDTVSDWAVLGESWSKMNLTYAAGYDPDSDSILDPIIIMGGGYDPCEDDDNGTTADNSCASPHVKIGNRIYVIDAVSGDILKYFDTDRSVPGDVTLVPVSDNNPNLRFAYAADTGGNIYRISGGVSNDPNDIVPIGTNAPDTWVMTKIASLGCNTVASCTNNRKFLFGPDVIRIPDTTDVFGVLLGSGDREKPLTDYSATTAVQNYFYFLVDSPLQPAWLDDSANSEYSCSNTDLVCMDTLTTVATGAAYDPTTVIDQWGWKLPMRSQEQVVTGAITLDNIVNFSTHIPAQAGACAAQYGTATAYQVNYANANGDTIEYLGGGLVPTPVAGKVLIDGEPYKFCMGCGDEGSPIGTGKVGGGITWTQPRSRVFWNIDKVPD